MPFLRRKHLVARATALILLAGFGLAGFMTLRDPPPAPNAPPQEADPSPLPLAGLTILVDPGHGGYDGGARCASSGVWEKTLNLQLGLRIQKSLLDAGARVVMTREKDEDLCTDDRPAALTKKRQDLEKRVNMAAQCQADMVLSIHMNEYRSPAESGPQVFYRAGCIPGRLLAGCIQQALIDGLAPKKERSAMAGDYFVLQLDIPSVLIECGFISNPDEEKLLMDPAYQQRLAQAVARGVQEYVTLTRRLREGPQGTPAAGAR